MIVIGIRISHAHLGVEICKGFPEVKVLAVSGHLPRSRIRSVSCCICLAYCQVEIALTALNSGTLHACYKAVLT